MIEFILWVWSLIQTCAHYIYDAFLFAIGLVTALYSIAFEYMSASESFKTVPHTGKMILSGLFAGLSLLVSWAVLRSLVPAMIRGHLNEAFGGGFGASSGGSSSSVTVRPTVFFDDPSIHVGSLRMNGNGSWNADIFKGQFKQNVSLGRGQIGLQQSLSVHGSRGIVQWGN